MTLQEVAKELIQLLSIQVKDFGNAATLQKGINLKIKEDRDPSIVLEELRQKENLLDQIKSRNEEFRPYIADWMQSKSEAQALPDWNQIMSLLDRLDLVVDELRVVDEEMIHLVQKREQRDTDPLLLIHAFRALS